MAQTVQLAGLKIKAGTKAQIDAAALADGLVSGQLYFISDTVELALGTGVNSYKTMTNRLDAGFNEDEIVAFAADGQVQSTGFKIDDTATEGLAAILWSASKTATFISDALSGLESGMGMLRPGVQNMTALLAIDTTVAEEWPDKTMILVEDKGLYRLDREAAFTADGNTVVDPTTGVGQWIKMTGTISNHNQLDGIQGGAEGEYYHLTAAQHTEATQYATTTLNGLLSATDWTTFNNKVGEGDTIDCGTFA